MNSNSIYGRKINSILVFLFITFVFPIEAQNIKDSLLIEWNENKNSLESRVDAYNKLIVNYYVSNKPDSAYVMSKNLEKFILSNNIKHRLGDVLITFGNIETNLGNPSKATTNYIKALSLFQKSNDKKGEAAALNNLGRAFKSLWDFDKALEYYKKSLVINTFLKDSIQISTNLTSIGNIYMDRFKLDEAIKYYDKSIEVSSNIDDLKGKTIAILNLGACYLSKKEYSKGLKLIDEALSYSRATNATDIEVYSLHMLMSHFYGIKMYDKSIFYGNQCLDIAKRTSNKTMIKNCNNIFYEIYKDIGNYKMAIKYLENSIRYNEQIDDIQSTQQLQRLEIDRIRMLDSIQTDKETIKLNLQHQLEIQQKNSEKRNLTLGLSFGLLMVTIIGFLSYKNTKRKQYIAEQRIEIEIANKEKILKDLELSTIDAMIEGQEKERQRLAADLHDSVGATLSAAKLQFDYLIKNQDDAKYSKELIKKTSTLLEDAYVEIRSMAHLKNSGVIAKNGLLPAVEKLSSNASVINGLTFEVQSYGLEQRLENSLEISIFRIIQELITNVIKHANATKGIIHLTNHEDNLNIMIEDNGIGFNPKQITKTNTGMGISNIDKRVEHLEGQFTIESEINKGTTVIIDIPT